MKFTAYVALVAMLGSVHPIQVSDLPAAPLGAGYYGTDKEDQFNYIFSHYAVPDNAVGQKVVHKYNFEKAAGEIMLTLGIP